MRSLLVLVVGLVVVPVPPVPPPVALPGASATARPAVRAPKERCAEHGKRNATTARAPADADRQTRVTRAR